MKRWTGSYALEDGRRLTFHVDAENWDDAVEAMELIGSNGEIYGELIEEGEYDLGFTQIGTA